MASEKIIEQKKKEVSELAEKIKEAKVVLLTDYRGISVADVTELRTKLREKSVEYKVIKNNIVRRALATNGETSLDEALEGPTAVITTEGEYLDPLKAIYKLSLESRTIPSK